MPMPQSLAKVLVHVIFSTKNRHPFIQRAVRPTLHAYLAGTLANLQSPSLQVGGTADHVHTLFVLGRTHALADVVEEAKKSSSKWMKQQGVSPFAWQTGYAAFSVSESQAQRVVRYIAAQEAQHRTVTFQEEFRSFLAPYAVTYDERYVWDWASNALTGLHLGNVG